MISIEKVATQIETNFFFFSFWLEAYKKCQKLSRYPVSQLLQFLTLNHCGYSGMPEMGGQGGH